MSITLPEGCTWINLVQYSADHPTALKQGRWECCLSIGDQVWKGWGDTPELAVANIENLGKKAPVNFSIDRSAPRTISADLFANITIDL